MRNFIARRGSGIVSEDQKTAKIALDPGDFVFTQSSIISSVSLETNSYLIRPETAKFINGNGDTWSNESLRANYRSFIGAFNYLNHVQEPAQAKGFIADAALRRIDLPGKRPTHIYYTDILVATHRDHTDLVAKILDGSIEFMSMGCDVFYSTCSKCGNITKEGLTSSALGAEVMMCECLLTAKGKSFIDTKGRRRTIAEILGSEKEGSCNFTEASWLSEPPAFGGAAKRHILPISPETSIEIQLPKAALEKEAMRKYLR